MQKVKLLLVQVFKSIGGFSACYDLGNRQSLPADRAQTVLLPAVTSAIVEELERKRLNFNAGAFSSSHLDHHGECEVFGQ